MPFQWFQALINSTPWLAVTPEGLMWMELSTRETPVSRLNTEQQRTVEVHSGIKKPVEWMTTKCEAHLWDHLPQSVVWWLRVRQFQKRNQLLGWPTPKKWMQFIINVMWCDQLNVNLKNGKNGLKFFSWLREIKWVLLGAQVLTFCQIMRSDWNCLFLWQTLTVLVFNQSFLFLRRRWHADQNPMPFQKDNLAGFELLNYCGHEGAQIPRSTWRCQLIALFWTSGKIFSYINLCSTQELNLNSVLESALY